MRKLANVKININIHTWGLVISDSTWLAISDSTSRKITKILVIYKRQWGAKFRQNWSNKRQHPFLNFFFNFLLRT